MFEQLSYIFLQSFLLHFCEGGLLSFSTQRKSDFASFCGPDSAPSKLVHLLWSSYGPNQAGQGLQG